ncbi:MAG: hypothetical protein BA863_03505 [Desulfovibrio sp. S3730MH75]|nr:MAG: hypothetical protein BA863_03505 [Desulfovibrio sp. S3730MH75]
MRVEVYEESAACDEFLFGSYSGNKVDMFMDESKLRKVHAALSEQCDFVAGLIAEMKESDMKIKGELS